MRRHRTTARGILLTLAAAGLLAAGSLAGAVTADASELPPTPSVKTPAPRTTTAQPRRAGVPQLIFPVVGPSSYVDDFGDARGARSHQGNDIMAPRRALAVAAEAGTVKFHTTSAAAGCMLYLYGRSGTTYLYIHLNNDLTSRNDSRGTCVAGVAYAKALKDGARVQAGDPVGYVGNSGDAEGGAPHLHFEVHPRGGAAVNPYRHLGTARRLLFAAKRGTTVNLTLTGSLVEAALDAVKVKVDRLRASTGLRIPAVRRTVELTLPPTAQVESATGQALARLVRVRTGQALEVRTEPAQTTLDAQLGLPGALAAERVVLR
jgi:hypothetical protein